jgi:hypothetical protein
MDTDKFKVRYSPGVFALRPSAFRLWLTLESDSSLRQRTYTELAEYVALNPETISAAMPDVAKTYREQQTIGYVPSLLLSASISNAALKVLVWMWLKANENASNRLYLVNDDIAMALDMSVETIEKVRREIAGKFVATEILSQRHAYMIRKPSQHLVNALLVHKSVTQFTLLNPETGNPVRERKVETIKYDVRLTNRMLERFGLKALQPLEEPGLRVLPNKDQLFVWQSGGWSLRKAESRTKSDHGKKQIAKGNIFELYQLLGACSPEKASEAVRYLDSTKDFAKCDYINLEKLDCEVLGEKGMHVN